MKPEATQKEFTEDGWFKTGDTAKVNMWTIPDQNLIVPDTVTKPDQTV